MSEIDYLMSVQDPFLDEETGLRHLELQHVTCKYCGTVGLHWEDWGGNFRLASDDNIVHSCKEYRSRYE